MNSVPYISFDVSKYDDLYEMTFDIRSAAEVLLKNGYDIAVRYEDAGIFLLEYSYTDKSLGSPRLCWLDPEEFEAIINDKEG